MDGKARDSLGQAEPGGITLSPSSPFSSVPAPSGARHAFRILPIDNEHKV